MGRYVNRNALGEAFEPLALQDDPQKRVILLKALEDDIVTRLLDEYERLSFELKMAGDSTGQIAEFLSISQRRVKHHIQSYADRTGQRNPLQRRSGDDAVDISLLVSRATYDRHRSAEPTPATT